MTSTIRDYCLNPEHPRGKHKAKVFQSSLGLTTENTEEVIAQIKNKVVELDCMKGETDEYGQRFTVDIEIEINEMKAIVRTG